MRAEPFSSKILLRYVRRCRSRYETREPEERWLGALEAPIRLRQGGNPTSVVEADGNRVTWTYDSIYQLKRETHTGTGACTLTHNYDPVGNRTAQADGPYITTSTYDAANQLSTSVPGTYTKTYRYDMVGNLEVEHVPPGVQPIEVPPFSVPGVMRVQVG